MNIDLKKFKKVQHTQSTTTLVHPDGHKIKVAHAGLDPATRKALGDLPMHYAQGGKVEDDNVIKPANIERPDKGWGSIIHKAEGGEIPSYNGAPIQIDPNAVTQQSQLPQDPTAPINAPTNVSNDDFLGMPSTNQEAFNAKQMAPQAPAAPGPQNVQLPTAQQGQGMPGMQGMSAGDMTQGLNTQMAGLKGEAKAQGELGRQSANIEQQHQAQIKDVMDQTARNTAQNEQETQGLVSDARNGHIDPQHYMNSKSDLGKVSTAIGLILGGIGGGLTHQENPALKFLMSNIDKDVEAQKANMGNKMNLLGVLEKQYQSKQDAVKMLHAFYLADTESKLKEAAAKAADPLAQARALQAIGPLQQQRAAIQQVVGMRQAVMNGVGNGQMDPAQAVPYLVPKEHQEKVFGEIEAAQNTRNMSKSILDSFEQAAKENTLMRTGAGLRTPGSVLALHQAMQPTFKDLEGTVRQAAMDNTFNNITPAPGDSEHKVAQKREALQNYLQSKISAPRAKGYGIDLSKYQSTRPMSNPKFKPMGN